MAVTKISVQQISNEIYELVGKNYLFVDKSKVSLDGTTTTLTSADLLNSKGVQPSWKEINKTAIVFVMDTAKDLILTASKVTGIDEANDEIRIVADTVKVDNKTDQEVTGTNGKSLIVNEANGGKLKFENTDGTWSFIGTVDGGATGVTGQLYSVKQDPDTGKYVGTRLLMTNGAFYYTKGKDDVTFTTDNELITKGDLDLKEDKLTFDSVPTQDSTNPVTSGGVYTAINNHITNKNNPHEVKADQIEFSPANGDWTVDDVAEALDDLKASKQENLTFDSTPTQGSNNPVTSDGIKTALDGKIDTTEKGANNGVAELDANGKVPASQLPSFVDDVIEGYFNEADSKFYEESTYTTEITGEASKIYVSLDTNKTYRWSGTLFVEISTSLALGETSTTAYRGDRGKEAYEHSKITSGNPHNVTAGEVGYTPTDSNWTVDDVAEALDDLKSDMSAVNTSVKDKIHNTTLTTDGTTTSFPVTIDNEVGDMVVGYFNGIRIFEGSDFTATRVDDTTMTIETLFDEPATAADKVYIEVIK